MDDVLVQMRNVLGRYPNIEIHDADMFLDKYPCVSFSFQGRQYQIIWVNLRLFPKIFLVDDPISYPHFITDFFRIKGKNYHYICLLEEESIIQYIHTDEEKIIQCMDQFVSLACLSKKEIVEEYQREFLVYWNRVAPKENSSYQLYLDNEDNFQWLSQKIHMQGKERIIRITKPDRYFNDEGKFSRILKIPVLYLPLQDITDFIPPVGYNPWTGKEICDIVENPQFQRISSEAYQEIKSFSYSHGSILLVFRLNNIFFGCVVQFKNSGTAKLIVKIESQIEKVIPLIIWRCDHEFLNRQIGNTVPREKVTIIGAGSLGSYVCHEMALAGYKNLTIVDGGQFDYDNTFRHHTNHFRCGFHKSTLLKYDSENIHPEIICTAICDYLNEENAEPLGILDCDILIFAVGSSDIQLRINRFLFESGFSKPIYYVMLEGDGATSHVVAVRDFSQGCFECLFTNDDGLFCENKINYSNAQTIRYIRNGCGGTRVPYGNRTLLTATATLLEAVKDKSSDNKVYSFTNNQMVQRNFPKATRCGCCGILK